MAHRSAWLNGTPFDDAEFERGFPRRVQVSDRLELAHVGHPAWGTVSGVAVAVDLGFAELIRMQGPPTPEVLVENLAAVPTLRDVAQMPVRALRMLCERMDPHRLRQVSLCSGDEQETVCALEKLRPVWLGLIEPLVRRAGVTSVWSPYPEEEPDRFASGPWMERVQSLELPIAGEHLERWLHALEPTGVVRVVVSEQVAVCRGDDGRLSTVEVLASSPTS